MENCEMCSEPVSGDREVMMVDGKPVHVGECCFWAMMGE